MKSPVPALGAFLALFLGFATADLTNLRWLGGLVLILIATFTGVYMFRIAGLGRTLISVVVVVLGFAASHPLGSVLGAYGSLLLVSLIAAVIIYLLTPRHTAA